MATELSNWPRKKRKGFTLFNGVTLLGGLDFWATTSPWACFLYISLREIMYINVYIVIT